MVLMRLVISLKGVVVVVVIGFTVGVLVVERWTFLVFSLGLSTTFKACILARQKGLAVAAASWDVDRMDSTLLERSTSQVGRGDPFDMP